MADEGQEILGAQDKLYSPERGPEVVGAVVLGHALKGGVKMNATTFSTLAISAAALIVVAFVLNYSITGSMVIREVETSEHADEIQEIQELSDESPEQTIHLNGYWQKSVVTVAFFSEGLTQSEFEELVQSARATMEVAQPGPADTTYIGWQDLLYHLESKAPGVPSLEIVDSDQADIKVFFDTSSHPAGKLGSAKIGRDKATFEIVFAEVRIFSAPDMYKHGLFEPVFKHEIGHALGIGHSTGAASIMHSPIIILDGEAVGGIRQCESMATLALYTDRFTKELSCTS